MEKWLFRLRLKLKMEKDKVIYSESRNELQSNQVKKPRQGAHEE